MTEKIVMTNSDEATAAIFGAFDSNIRMIERAFDVRIFNRNKETTDGDAIVVSGEADAVNRAVRTLEYLYGEQGRLRTSDGSQGRRQYDPHVHLRR